LRHVNVIPISDKLVMQRRDTIMSTGGYDDDACPSEWAEYNLVPELVAQPAVLSPFARHAVAAAARRKSGADQTGPDRRLQGLPLDAMEAPGWPPALLRS
jgi:hypothetical protein